MSSSAPLPDADPVPDPAPEIADDRSTAARIRDAAVVCFAAAGVSATSVRAIAAEADVSPALVIHHFGSKDQLRVACDEHVAALVRSQKQAAMAAGAQLDVLGALRTQRDGLPVLGYLARTLTDGSPHVAELVDELVADAVGYMADGVAAGVLRPSDAPHARAALLTIWSLGALVLHEHTSRLLGADLLGDVAEAQSYLGAGLEILGQGVLTPATYQSVREQLDAAAGSAGGAATDRRGGGDVAAAGEDPRTDVDTMTDGGRS